MKKIQFTSGCPNNCSYCYEPKEREYYDPEIPEGEELVQISDMNFLSNPKHEEIMIELMEAKNKHYELICGVDYRLLNQELCNFLHNARFIKMRWAWIMVLIYKRYSKKLGECLRKQVIEVRICLFLCWLIGRSLMRNVVRN